VTVKMTEIFLLICINRKETFYEIFNWRFDGFDYHFCWSFYFGSKYYYLNV